MSLLDRGTDTVLVFPEEMIIDSDGNKFTRPATTGAPFRAVVQPLGAGSVAPRETTDGGGFSSVSRYRLRLINHPGVLGARSQVEWNGQRYSIDGDAMVFNGSPRTRHVDYVMVRS